MSIRNRNRSYSSNRTGTNRNYQRSNMDNRNTYRRDRDEDRGYDRDDDIRAGRERGIYEDEYSPSYGSHRRDRNVFERTADRIRDKWNDWTDRDERDEDRNRERDYDYEDSSYRRNIDSYDGGYADTYGDYEGGYRRERGGYRDERNREGWNDQDRYDDYSRRRNEGNVYGVNDSNYDRYRRDRRPYGSENTPTRARRRKNAYTW